MHFRFLYFFILWYRFLHFHILLRSFKSLLKLSLVLSFRFTVSTLNLISHFFFIIFATIKAQFALECEEDDFSLVTNQPFSITGHTGSRKETSSSYNPHHSLIVSDFQTPVEATWETIQAAVLTLSVNSPRHQVRMLRPYR